MKTSNQLMKIFLSLCFFTASAQPPEKPNILFIPIDDLRTALGCYGDSYAQTPEIDAIADLGTVFLNNHTQKAVCGPSRASLLTGKRPDYTEVWDLETLIRDIHPDIVTLPQHFKNKGYTTTGVGKTFDSRSVDGQEDAISWSIPYSRSDQLDHPNEYGPPILGYYQTAEIKNEYETRMQALIDADPTLSNEEALRLVSEEYKPIIEIGDGIPDNAYKDGAIADKAIELLQDLADNNTEPFFLSVGFKKPHLPFSLPKTYYDLYDPSQIILAPFQQMAEDMPSLALWSSNEFKSYKTPGMTFGSDSLGLIEIDNDDQRDLIHGYYAATSFIDAQIGKIIDKLEETGLDENTIIVIWSDHGFHLGDHKCWGKHTNLEQATRSPLIIYDPRSPNPDDGSYHTTTQPTALLDIFPTLCDMTGIDLPALEMDGVSLKPLMTDPTVAVKDYVVSQFSRNTKYGYSFRTEHYRYTVWLYEKRANDGPTASDYYEQELYDYQVDGGREEDNKFNDPAYATIQATLVAKAQAYFDEQSAGVALPQPELITNGDFEEEPFDTGWTVNTLGTAVVELENAGVDAASGDHGAKVTVTGVTNNSQVEIQNTEFESDLSGKEIVIRLNAKAATEGSRFKLRMIAKGTNDYYIPSPEFTLDTHYASYEYVYNVPDDYITSIRLDILCGFDNDEYFFDDVTYEIKKDIIKNKDFEADVYDENWTFATKGSAVAAMSNAASDAYEGNNAAKIAVTTADGYNGVRLMNTIFSEEDLSGETLHISLNAKAMAGSQTFKLRVVSVQNGIAAFDQSNAYPLTTDYQDFTYSYTVPNNTSHLRVDVICGSDVGVYFFDNFDVSLTTTNQEVLDQTPTHSQENQIPTREKAETEVASVSVYNAFGALLYSGVAEKNIPSHILGYVIIKTVFSDGTFEVKKVIL